MKIPGHVKKDFVKGESTPDRMVVKAHILKQLIKTSSTGDPWSDIRRLQDTTGYKNFGAHLPHYSLQALIKLGWVRRRFFKCGGKNIVHFQVTQLGLDHAYFIHVKEKTHSRILHWFRRHWNNRMDITRQEVALGIGTYRNPSTKHFVGTWKNLVRLGYIVPTRRGKYTFNPNPVDVTAPTNPSPFISNVPPTWAD